MLHGDLKIDQTEGDLAGAKHDDGYFLPASFYGLAAKALLDNHLTLPPL